METLLLSQKDVERLVSMKDVVEVVRRPSRDGRGTV